MKNRLKIKTNAGKVLTAVVLVILIAIGMAISFFGTAGVLWLICWAFNWSWWSWRACFGVWLALDLVAGIFHIHTKE